MNATTILPVKFTSPESDGPLRYREFWCHPITTRTIEIWVWEYRTHIAMSAQLSTTECSVVGKSINDAVNLLHAILMGGAK